MSKHGLGSLADLAKILEEASNPDSERREDRKETKPKLSQQKKVGAAKKVRTVDPKRKLWYEKRLKEQAEKPAEIRTSVPESPAALVPKPAVAVKANLLEILASAKEAKPKDEQKQRGEAWRRKPGDPIF